MRAMNPARVRQAMATVCLLFLIALCFWAGRAAAAPEGSPWGANYFPNIGLINQDGKTLRFYDDMIKGKVVAINFMYTSCEDSCPLETAKLRQVQEILGERVGKDIFFYSISIDPARDTPEALKAYAKLFKIRPGWQFLTGKIEDINGLRRKLGLYEDEEREKRKDHTMSMIVGNEATGRWIKRSSFDNPKVMAKVLGERLFNYKASVGQSKGYAEASQIGKLDRGEDLFRRRCQVCHTVGAGDALGPDLLGVVANRDRGWLQRWLKNPDQVLAARDPIAMALYAKFKKLTMPNLKLTDSETEALIDYLDAESRRVKSRQRAGAGDTAKAAEHHQHQHHHHAM